MTNYIESWPIDVKPVPAAEPGPAAAVDAAAVGGGEAAVVDEGVFLAASNAEEEAKGEENRDRTQVIQPTGEGWQGAWDMISQYDPI